jgi:hypothetical protein
MRSLIAFIACTGFIVWAHSCETRIVGVKAYVHHPVSVSDGFSHQSRLKPQQQVLFAHAPKPVSVDALLVSDLSRVDMFR